MASYAGCNELLAVAYLSISIAGHGFNAAGAAINLFDLSPNYAAPLNAVINSLSSIVGMSAPYIAGVMTPNVSLKKTSIEAKVQAKTDRDLFDQFFKGISVRMAIGVLGHIRITYSRGNCIYDFRQC